MARLALLLLAMLAVAQAEPLIQVMNKAGFTDFALMLRVAELDIDNEKVGAVGTLLVPTNQAVAAFAASMGMTTQELLASKGLVDSILSYHFAPGLALTKGSADTMLSGKPMLIATAELGNYISAAATSAGVVLKDMQGNSAKVLSDKNAQDGKLVAWGIDRVLMSGAYFTSVATSLKFNPMFSTASELAAAASKGPRAAAITAALDGSSTLFAPTNAAFAASGVSLSTLNAATAGDVLLYHMLSGSRVVPTDFKSNQKLRTLLEGHTVKTWVNERTTVEDPFSGGQVSAPLVTVVPEVGRPANVIAPNIYVRRTVVQGINGVLTPYGVKLAGARAGRRLLQGGSGGIQRSAARQWASINTSNAISAAATGRVPTNFATNFGTEQSRFAAAGCFNCVRWGSSVGFL